MVYDKANELAADIKASEEYKRFCAAKDKIEEGSTTASLLKEYRKLQLRAQAAMVAGEEDAECMEKLQKLGEILQMDKTASEYLISEFMLSRMLGDIYKILADAVDVDLSMLEN
jgi:cell fate (sporulation/competence/biofilm development) regulator YlbF (YheA/YmcA/DUF963 family)